MERCKKFIGSLPLDNKFKSIKKDKKYSYPIYVRVTWKNKYGHVFDEIHKYKLICTVDKVANDPYSGRGRSFTFIPEGVISKKGKELI